MKHLKTFDELNESKKLNMGETESEQTLNVELIKLSDKILDRVDSIVPKLEELEKLFNILEEKNTTEYKTKAKEITKAIKNLLNLIDIDFTDGVDIFEVPYKISKSAKKDLDKK